MGTHGALLSGRREAGGGDLPLHGGAYEGLYLALAALFLGALVACNLIFQKFFELEIALPWRDGEPYVLRQSVGLIAYPLTFLVTDVLSEVYGQRRANQVVTAGFGTSVFVVLLVEFSDAARSAPFGIGSETFHQVFGLSKIAVLASMMAYLAAQYLDVRLFHFWRRLTRGRHLWLRNNGSTLASQLVDTTVVLALLAALAPESGITWDRFPELFVGGLVFKWAVALADTPFFYAAVFACRRAFPEQMVAMDAEWCAPSPSPSP